MVKTAVFAAIASLFVASAASAASAMTQAELVRAVQDAGFCRESGVAKVEPTADAGIGKVTCNNPAEVPEGTGAVAAGGMGGIALGGGLILLLALAGGGGSTTTTTTD